jgi:hypothetical protein
MSLPPTHPNTKKYYYALLKPDPPVSFLPLLLHLSSSLPATVLAAGAWSFPGPQAHQCRPQVKLHARREANDAGTPSLHTGRASRPQSREHVGAAFEIEASHTEDEVMGSPAAPPRLELPPRGRRSGEMGSRARRQRLLESSTSSPTGRLSRRRTGAALGSRSPVRKLASWSL